MSLVSTNSISAAGKAAEVWERLEHVTDPELDESVTEMQFITRVDIDGEGGVCVEFRLPTYWCAANFAFMMADDMRLAVGALSWVKRVTVVLGEHMYADTINEGIAAGRGFRETFGGEADGDLEDLRRTFLVKAFQRRQEALLAHLTAGGWTPEALAALSVAELRGLVLDVEGERLVRRYLERRGVVGAVAPEVSAFVTATGEALPSDAFGAYVKGLRRVGVNAEFNGALCRGLLAARFDMTTPFRSTRESLTQPS